MITVIIPYYRQPEMLKAQLRETSFYSPDIRVTVVDDGSPEPAADVFAMMDTETFARHARKRTALYRHTKDIPWNREQARNLGGYTASTKWIIHVDIDHILPAMNAEAVLQEIRMGELSERDWYAFPRKRIGRADEFRQKDQIPEDAKTGWIKPHVDSFLITRERFLKSPYDERYSGMLGGGTPFTARQNRVLGERKLLDRDSGIWLEVHTQDSVKDSSITTLSRDKTAYSELRTRIGANDAPPMILTRSPWEVVQWC